MKNSEKLQKQRDTIDINLRSLSKGIYKVPRITSEDGAKKVHKELSSALMELQFNIIILLECFPQKEDE